MRRVKGGSSAAGKRENLVEEEKRWRIEGQGGSFHRWKAKEIHYHDNSVKGEAGMLRRTPAS